MDPQVLMSEWMPDVSPINHVLFGVATGTVTLASCASFTVAYKCVQWQRKDSNSEKITQVKEQVRLLLKVFYRSTKVPAFMHSLLVVIN